MQDLSNIYTIHDLYVDRGNEIVIEKIKQSNLPITIKKTMLSKYLGEKDPIVLEFDHFRDKKCDVSKLATNSLDILVLEIEKCEVRCANCHRRKTAKQFGYYKNIKL